MNAILRRRRGMMGTNKKAEIIFDTQPHYTIKTITDGSDNACQGCCAVGNTLYFASINSDSTEQKINSINLLTMATSNHGSYTDLGHANSITYVPDENALYVATMNASTGVAVISLDDFTISKTIQLKNANGNAYTPWAIAFDRKRNVLYSNETYRIGVFTPAGERIGEISLIDRQTHTTAQGMETDGDYLYLLWSKPANVIDVYSIDGQFIKTQTMSSANEVEELAYDWDGNFYADFFIRSQQRRFESCLVRTFDGWAKIAYTPAAIWNKYQTGGTVTVSGLHEVLMTSTAAASFNIVAKGVGYPFGYADIVGKKMRISGTEIRTGGTSGQIAVNIFTTNKENPTTGSDRLYYVTRYFGIPDSGVTKYFKYEFYVGGDWFAPPSDKYGTKIGYWLFNNSNSGNNVKVDLKVEVKLA